MLLDFARVQFNSHSVSIRFTRRGSPTKQIHILENIFTTKIVLHNTANSPLLRMLCVTLRFKILL